MAGKDQSRERTHPVHDDRANPRHRQRNFQEPFVIQCHEWAIESSLGNPLPELNIKALTPRGELNKEVLGHGLL